MSDKNTPNDSNNRGTSPEDDKYDFTNLTFEELFRVPVVEMSFRGEPLAGPDFFQLDFLALQRIPVFLSKEDKDKANDVGNTDNVDDDSYDFLALSFEDLLKVPVRLNRWQDGDDTQEPDLDSLSLADLMKLPVRRSFIADLDPETLNKLLGDSAFSDLPSTDSGSSSGNSGNPLLYINYGNTDRVSDTSPPIDNSGDNNSGGGSGSGGGGFTPPPPDGIPVAASDGGFFAIKGFGFAPFSNNTGNLLANDQPGLDNPISVNNLAFNNGSIPGTIIVNPNGSFSYLPTGIDNNSPGSPTDYVFSYRVVDFNGTLSNYADVSIKVYDPPVLSINDVQIVEGPGATIALFTVVLTGAIPIPLTITYATHDGNVANHTAVAGQDYQSTSGSYTFSNINPAVITQSFTISVTVLDDNIAELVQKFFVNLNIAGTFVNAGASDLIGVGAISDPDMLLVTNVDAGSVHESGLTDGSNPNVSDTILSGNLLAGQNFGQIPNPSGVDISDLNHPDASGPAIYDSGNKTWTLTGDYFTLVVYRENVAGHNKGEYLYTLTDNITHTNNQDFFDHLQFDLTPIDPESTIDQTTRTDTGDLNVTIVDDLVTAQDDTGTFYAIKGSNAGNSSGNLFANDTASADRPLTIVSFNYIDENGDPQTALVANGDSTSVTPYYGGTLTVHSDGSYEYAPPNVDNVVIPGEPHLIEFSYKAQDTDGTYDNANVNIQLYDQPKLTIDNVQVIEGDNAVALFTVTLTGAIPTALTINYSTQDGTAIAGEDYQAILNGSHTFNDLDPTHTTQSFTISVNILNDNIAELVQHFSLVLDINGTYINTTTSELTGDAAISDPDAIHVNNIDAGTVYESGLADGSDVGNQSIELLDNLLTGQNFGEIPNPSGVDISDLSHPDANGPAMYDSGNKTWTLSGDYFTLVVYREDIGSHIKGDYIYTLTSNVDNINGSDFLQDLHFDITPIDPDSLITDQTTRTDTGDLNVAISDDSPQAQDDTDVFYAMKGGDDANASGNLLTNDVSGADNSLKIVSITYTNQSNVIVTESIPGTGTIEVTPYYGGTLSVNVDGTFSYIPPDVDDLITPSTPDLIQFSYTAEDTDGSQSSADVDVKLYDQPKISIDDVQIIEGTDLTAVFTVTLTGAIPAGFTIHYSTQDGTAVAGQDYVALLNIAHTFNASDLASQSFQVSVDILDDNITELLQNFSLVLDTTGTPINLTISDDAGNGAISDPDVLQITDVPGGTIDEADLSDGSNPNPPPITLTGNLLAGQDLGQIPLSGVVLSHIGHPDGITTETSSTATVTGSYFSLVVYLDDSTVGHVKGDYVYTLTNDVDNVSGADFIQNIHFDVTPVDPGSLITDQTTRTDTGELIIHIKDDAPIANDDAGVFYAIKGGDDSQAHGNLLTNDVAGADNNLKIISITYTNLSNMIVTENVPNTGSLEMNPYYGGTLNISANGQLSYIPPDADDSELPGAPDTIAFSYKVEDADGSLSNSANVDIKLYDQPIIYVHEASATEGTDGFASVVVELIGHIPNGITVNYATQDDSAIAPGDYTHVSGSINFNTLNVTSQQQTIQVPIIDDTDVELTEKFIFTISDSDDEVNLNSAQAQYQADITILDNDVSPSSFTLKATNDAVTVSELALNPNLPVTTPTQSGNVLANDTTTNPIDALSVNKIQFVAENLLVNHPTLYQNYMTQGAAITPNGNLYTVQFNLPANNAVLSINMPDNSILKIQSNGHYDFYQPQGGISQDSHYDWTYTITAPNALPVNAGDDKGVLSINVENQLVYANNDQLFTKTTPQLNYNLVLILDISSGMNGKVDGLSRLALEKMAAINIINQFDALAADLKITIIPFGSDSNNAGGNVGNYSGAFDYQASSVTGAINYINNVVSPGMTNPDTNKKIGGGSEYDDALFHARAYLNTSISPSSAIDDYQHVVYFMSNGSPNSPATNLTPSWQNYINDPDNVAFGGVAGSTVTQINVIPVTIDVTQTTSVINAMNPIGNTNLNSEIVNLDYNGTQIVNLSDLYTSVSNGNTPVTINLLANDLDTFDAVIGDLKVTQVSYFNPTLNTNLVYNLSDAHPQEVFTTAKGATVTINTDGTFIYQAGPGFNAPNEISEVFNYKMTNDSHIVSNEGQISATTYNNNYTLVNLPGTSGNDILNNNGVNNQGTVVMSGAGGNNTFTIDMGMSGLKANLIVIQDFATGGNNTLKFINVGDANHDTVIQNSEIIAQISNVHSDSPYAGGNISFQLQNGTTVIMQNLGASDPLAAPPATAAALISLVDEHGNIVGTSS